MAYIPLLAMNKPCLQNILWFCLKIKVYKCYLSSFLLNLQIFMHKLGIIIYFSLIWLAYQSLSVSICNLFFEDTYLLKRVTFLTSPLCFLFQVNVLKIPSILNTNKISKSLRAPKILMRFFRGLKKSVEKMPRHFQGTNVVKFINYWLKEGNINKMDSYVIYSLQDSP